MIKNNSIILFLEFRRFEAIQYLLYNRNRIRRARYIPTSPYKKSKSNSILSGESQPFFTPIPITNANFINLI